MQSLLFLFTKEFKKIICNKGMFVFPVAFILNIINLLSEYIDRSKSVMFSNGVHVEGKGLEYFLDNQNGNFGVFVLYLLTLMLFTSSLFSDEYRQNMVASILVTKLGRTKDAAVKVLCNFIITVAWVLLCYGSSVILSYKFFDIGIIIRREDAPSLIRCCINIILGSFLMVEIFAFVSSLVKSNISAVVINFVILVIPMYITSSSKLVRLIPIIGMQAKNYLEDISFYKVVWAEGAFV